MDEVLRYWDNTADDMVTFSITELGAYMWDCEGEIQFSSLEQGLEFFAKQGHELEFYDGFETWDDYDEYITL